MMSEGDIAGDAEGDAQGDEPTAPEGPNADPIRSRRSAKDQAKELLKDLREMQKTRHTMDIVRDVLGDERVKLYAHMRPGGRCSGLSCG